MQDDKVYVNKKESHTLYTFKLLCILYTNKEPLKQNCYITIAINKIAKIEFYIN